MVIDKVGGVGPGYGPRKSDGPSRPEKPVKSSDNVTISKEATRAADVARITKMVRESQETERAEKLEQVRERLKNGDYDNLSDETLGQIARNVTVGIPNNQE